MKKVAIFVCHDLTGLIMLNKVVPRMISMGLTPVIYNTKSNRNKTFKVPTPSLVSAFNVGILENVIIPFLETQNIVSGEHLTYKQLCFKHGIEYKEILDVNVPEVRQGIKNDPYIIGGISLRFLQVFEDSIIDTMKEKGFFWNLHSGLLGDYKGLLTPYRAIENGEKEYGLTLHEISTGIDEGAIIDKGILTLDKAKPVMELYLDTVDIATQITTDALQKVSQGLAVSTAPQITKGRYYPNPTTQEFINFIDKNIIYADMNTTVGRISNAFTKVASQESKDLQQAILDFISGKPDIRNFLRKAI